MYAMDDQSKMLYFTLELRTVIGKKHAHRRKFEDNCEMIPDFLFRLIDDLLLGAGGAWLLRTGLCIALPFTFRVESAILAD
jgi:hypothetical protein